MKGLIGVVADIIKVDKEYEIAIETALGGSIQNIVTDNEDTAKSMIDFLKRNKFGRGNISSADKYAWRRRNQESGSTQRAGSDRTCRIH